MNHADLVHIAQKANGPVYVYDAAKIKSQYQRLTNAFRGVEQLRLHYATKALNNISILKYIQGLGAGLDTVSIQEVQLGLKAGFDPSTIIFTPNGVSLSEIEAVAKMGVQINIDNLSILEQFEQIPRCTGMYSHQPARNGRGKQQYICRTYRLEIRDFHPPNSAFTPHYRKHSNAH